MSHLLKPLAPRCPQCQGGWQGRGPTYSRPGGSKTELTPLWGPALLSVTPRHGSSARTGRGLAGTSLCRLPWGQRDLALSQWCGLREACWSPFALILQGIQALLGCPCLPHRACALTVAMCPQGSGINCLGTGRKL